MRWKPLGSGRRHTQAECAAECDETACGGTPCTLFALQYGGVCFCYYDLAHATEYGPAFPGCGVDGGAWCNYIMQHSMEPLSGDPIHSLYLSESRTCPADYRRVPQTSTLNGADELHHRRHRRRGGLGHVDVDDRA